MCNEHIQYLTPLSNGWCDFTENNTNENKALRKGIQEYLLTSLQMQHLVVLAGCGTSIGEKINGPSMSELWEEIETLSTKNGIKIKRENIADKIKYYGQNIEEFLTQCESYLQIFGAEDKKVKIFYLKSKEKILKKCSSVNTEEEALEAHRTFLYKLSRRRIRDSRLKLFTTNYDLCFERAASYQGLIAIDGFSFVEPRRFDPKYFNYDIVRRSRPGEETVSYIDGVFHLHKLHGSVNWARIGNEIIIKNNPTPEEACLIYPAGEKYQQSYNQPFLENMAHYLSFLREPNTCIIVIGFGFNDKHISEPLISAVKSNPHLRLIIVDKNAYKNIEVESSNCSVYWSELKKLSKRGYDISFINSSFEDFVNIIPDLKALTPAEQLYRNIRSLVEERDYE